MPSCWHPPPRGEGSFDSDWHVIDAPVAGMGTACVNHRADERHGVMANARRTERAPGGDSGRPQLAPRPARGVRCRAHRRGNSAVRVVPPRTPPLRGGVRDARRRRTHPRQQRSGHHPVPAQPLRRPQPQTRCTPWSRSGFSTSNPPATTSPAEPQKGRPAARSNAAWLATSPATSTAYPDAVPNGLDEA
jgi:hypothetical protein